MRVIAIDGPAGSGKSSVSREAARRLGFGYLDTGAAYRALAWWALDLEIAVTDETAVAGLLDGFPYTISLDPVREHVVVGEVEVTDSIRDPRISLCVSAVATNRRVREWMRDHARRVVSDCAFPGVVAEGRDLTTVVFPDADVRILLTARADVRVARRAREVESGDGIETTTSVIDRDARDSTVVNFTEPAPGVSLIDSSEMDLERTVTAVLDAVADGGAN